MAKEGEIYECKICNVKVKVSKGGGGTLKCCGKDMELKEEEKS